MATAASPSPSGPAGVFFLGGYQCRLPPAWSWPWQGPWSQRTSQRPWRQCLEPPLEETAAASRTPLWSQACAATTTVLERMLSSAFLPAPGQNTRYTQTPLHCHSQPPGPSGQSTLQAAFPVGHQSSPQSLPSLVRRHLYGPFLDGSYRLPARLSLSGEKINSLLNFLASSITGLLFLLLLSFIILVLIFCAVLVFLLTVSGRLLEPTALPPGGHYVAGIDSNGL